MTSKFHFKDTGPLPFGSSPQFMWSSYFVHCYYQMVPGDSILLDLSHHSGNSIDVWFDNWKQLEEPNWLQMRAPSLWTSRLCEFSNIYFHRGNALWPFLCRKLPIGKFKLQVLFSLGSFVSDKNVWNALSLSFKNLDASWLKSHEPANSQKDQYQFNQKKNRMWWIWWGPVQRG